jgi:uncharacterized protein (TIGR00255 family)
LEELDVNSMTGYASHSFEYEEYTVFIEIRSLNNKFLDIKFKLPFYLVFLEENLRRIMKEYVKRGKVDVFVKVVAKEIMERKLLKEMFEKYRDIIREIEDETEHHLMVSLSELLALRSFFSGTDEGVRISIPEKEFIKMYRITVVEFQKSRNAEGEMTKAELIEYVREVESFLQKVESEYPPVVDKYKEQLRGKIRELIDSQLDETRLIMEIALFANKVDISEEISRIKGHLKKIEVTIQKDRANGRELDFILQEVNREINTIGSKVPDYSVSENVVDMKTVLEKIISIRKCRRYEDSS